jgi:predicted AAA+ superfamily ATPase
MDTYYKRLDERVLERKLHSEGGVVVEGPRFCGKSTLALHLANSSVRLDQSPSLLRIAQIEPSEILRGKTPRLIDEWQLATNVWNAVRHEIDSRQKVGQFILTGSTTPTDDITRHSGAGRIGRVKMRTMSLSESKKSEERVNFANLFDKDKWTGVAGYGGLTVPEYCEEIVRGGWPSLLNSTVLQSIETVDDYVDNLSRMRLNDEDEAQTETRPERMVELMTAISRNISTEASNEKIASESKISTSITLTKYLDKMTGIFVLENLPAWRTHIRSSVQQRVKPKWHFVDPSLPASRLGLSPQKLLNDLESAGLFFESLAIRDLRIYANVLGGTVSHYRDNSGLEVDAIVQLRDGRWSAFEIKLGNERHIKAGMKNLKKLTTKVTDKVASDMVSLNVITAGNVSYHDEETNMNVISLGHLFV